MERSFPKFFCWLTVVVGVMWAMSHLTACNTVHGAGQDIEAGGQALQDASD